MASSQAPPEVSTNVFRQEESFLYVLFCPCGVEEVAREELDNIATYICSQESSQHANAELVDNGVCIWSQQASVKSLGAPQAPRGTAGGDQRADLKRQRQQPKPALVVAHTVDPASTTLTPEDRARRLKGAVYFQLSPSFWTVARRAKLFFLMTRLARTVEMCAVHLFTTPCKDTVAALNTGFTTSRDHIHRAVMQEVSNIRRATCGLGQEPLLSPHVQLLGPAYTTPLTGTSVLFRVNSVRRDKSVKCGFSSQDLAVHAGDQLIHLFEDAGWRVSMVYHNLEFFLLHDEHTAHLCVALSPPPLPRCGSDTDVAAQCYMEHVRQRLTSALIKGTASAAELKALIPRPSSHRVELRRFKGDNAMHPALAQALIRYADIDEGMVVLDPFAGSGTILVEAAADAWRRRSLQHRSDGAAPPSCHGLVLVSGERSLKDASRTAQNLQQPLLVELAAPHGLLPTLANKAPQPAVTAGLEAWISQIRQDVENLDVRTALTPAEPLDATEAQRRCLVTLVQTLTQDSSLLAGAHVYVSCLADATQLPLRSSTVDRILTDMPFGRRCGNHNVNRRLYPCFLRECYRVLRKPACRPTTEATSLWCVEADEPHRLRRVREMVRQSHGGRAVLLTIEGRLMYESLAEVRDECPFQLATEPFALDMGGLFPYVFILDT